MLAKLEQHGAPLKDRLQGRYIMVVIPKTDKLDTISGLAGRELLEAVLSRKKMKPAELAASPVSATLPDGGLVSWAMLDIDKPQFERLALMRKTASLLLEESPEEIVLAVGGDGGFRRIAAELALYAAWINGTPLPDRKSSKSRKPLSKILLHGWKDEASFPAARAVAEGNLLARQLTVLPPNELTPGLYRERVGKLARAEGWKIREYDIKALRKMGAGAFLAVAQGSPDEDAAIVHIRYRPQSAAKSIALVGKGICFDTGGHNLKPARHMHGMHEDMNGSAVALGILQAAARMGLPVSIDCWLALAQNHISPRAYKQNDVITALNGTTIEIIHTDAEGRLVLADTLTLAARNKPDLVVDFATLTGSMLVALGNRYSGIFSNRRELVQQALAAGVASGERVCAFPFDPDYEPALESKVADVKQCTLEGDADHILAARFLSRFVGETPWVHMDLAASNCPGGLGAVATDVTGFGVAWGVEMLRNFAP